MQRENNILIKYKKNRTGFAMMMAIMVIVIIATLMAASLSMTAETSKRTTDVYMHEQALLLTRSATEYALLKLSGENRTGLACLNNIAMAYPTNAAATKLFDITINISYYGLETVCNNSLNPAPNNMQTAESTGTILLDVMVSSNPNLPIEPIRYHRRTLQKL